MLFAAGRKLMTRAGLLFSEMKSFTPDMIPPFYERFLQWMNCAV
ncbi:hypothetical protein [Mesotoga prima]|nr:hypothetical protein [Mesotoga prima]CCU85034.1 hypothetical protein PHOSAC3_150034 [Mesotoga infera]HPA00272.1 hypothetical protein [Mesotoga prima]